MKPDNIILIRHGQSVGNVDRSVYDKMPDYALQLTPIGLQQAWNAGKRLFNIIQLSSVQFYGSSFWRTRQTYQQIRRALMEEQNKSFSVEPVTSYPYYEDPRLVEQDWGHCQSVRYNQAAEDARDAYGSFYYRFRDGESCADVFGRVSSFLDTLWRDFTKPTFPKNTVIITHGMTMRVFLMRFLHYTVEEFECLKNPPNCEFFILKNVLGKYRLVNDLGLPHYPERWPHHTHPYQYDWSKLA